MVIVLPIIFLISSYLPNNSHCSSLRLHKDRLEEECDHISPLQSWGPELRYFTELPSQPEQTEGSCDVVIDKPTYFLKIDASGYF